MRVFVAGASGVVGRPLCRALLAAGHEVVAITRTAATAEKLRSEGIEPVVADIYDEPAIVSAAEKAKPDAIVHQLTSIPARTNPRTADRDFGPTNRLRTEGTAILMKAAAAAGAKRFIAQSISFVLPPEGPSPAAEEAVWEGEKGFKELNGAVKVLEATVTGAPNLVGIALRYGAFYGPGTVFSPGGSFYEDARRRRLPVVGAGLGTFSFIHVEDAALAAVAALSKGDAGVYNIVDDEPAPIHTWLPYFAECIGAKRPFSIPAFMASPVIGHYGDYLMTKQRGASNEKAERVLGWKPTIASWRQGFRDRLDR